jgi:hypothetical protein
MLGKSSCAAASFPGAWDLCSILLVLILDGEFRARGALVLAADKVRDGLVLRLLGRTLIVLWALTENLFLDKVDG